MMPQTKTMLRACLQADPSIISWEKLLTLLERHGEVPANPPRLLRRLEVAQRLSCSVRAVDRLCREGALSKRVLPGRKRSTGVLESDVDTLIRGEGRRMEYKTNAVTPLFRSQHLPEAVCHRLKRCRRFGLAIAFCFLLLWRCALLRMHWIWREEKKDTMNLRLSSRNNQPSDTEVQAGTGIRAQTNRSSRRR